MRIVLLSDKSGRKNFFKIYGGNPKMGKSPKKEK